MKNETIAQKLDGYWREAKAVAIAKVSKNHKEMISLGLILRHASEDAAVRATKQASDTQENLKSILLDMLSYPIKVWDWATADFVEPPEPKLPRPDLIPMPTIPKLSEADASSYSLKPSEPVIRKEDMPAVEVTDEPIGFIDSTSPAPTQKHWIGQQFHSHPYICWGLVIAVLIIMMSEQ